MPAHVKAEAARKLTSLPDPEKAKRDGKASQELIEKLRRSETRKHRALRDAVKDREELQKHYGGK